MSASRLLLAGLALLAACAPAATGPSTRADALAVSERGEVAWAVGGRAYLARPPQYRPESLPAPALVTGLAWRGSEPWLAAPDAGLVLAAGGVPASLPLPGRPARLSPSLVFALDGGVYTYGGGTAGRLPGLPESVLEVGGRVYALAGNVVYEIAGGRAGGVERVGNVANPVLLPDGERYEVAAGPAARLGRATYRVAGGRLELQDGGRGASVPAPEGVTVLAAGGDVVAALTPTGPRLYRAGTLEPVGLGAASVGDRQ